MSISLHDILKAIAAKPASLTFRLEVPAESTLEPLLPTDGPALHEFYEKLSSSSKKFYSVVDPSIAYVHCAAIAKYDKLRLVLREPAGDSIIAIVEFSFDLTPGDLERYAGYGLELDPPTVCRWGLCVTDQWHGLGMADGLFAASIEIARRFGRSRIILWGGVRDSNARAVRFYRRNGFAEVGRFRDNDSIGCIDMWWSGMQPNKIEVII